MDGAVSIYRTLLFLRGCWLLLEWLFAWGPHARINSVALLHPYAALFADAAAVASWLVSLGGLWFFRRWARLIFFWCSRPASFTGRLGRTTTTGQRHPHLF